jgi:hypothetical protein
MTTPSQIRVEPIIVAQAMPLPIRIMLGGSGALVCFLLLMELGPALWPLSFLTLFFGVIVLGGLSIGIVFIAGAILSPDHRWEIGQGSLAITYQLRDQIATKTYFPTDFDTIEIRETDKDSGPNTFELVCQLSAGKFVDTGIASSGLLLRIVSFMKSPAAALSVDYSATSILTSPSFPTKEQAQKALAQFQG